MHESEILIPFRLSSPYSWGIHLLGFEPVRVPHWNSIFRCLCGGFSTERLTIHGLARSFHRGFAEARSSFGNQSSGFELGAWRSSKMSIFVLVSSFLFDSVLFLLDWFLFCVSGLESMCCWLFSLKLIQICLFGIFMNQDWWYHVLSCLICRSNACPLGLISLFYLALNFKLIVLS